MTQAPSARSGHSAMWSGQEMVVLNGKTASGEIASGGAYDPAANKWRALTNPGAPVARTIATAVWSGTEALIFGGQVGGQPVAVLQRLNPQPAWHFFRKP